MSIRLALLWFVLTLSFSAAASEPERRLIYIPYDAYDPAKREFIRDELLGRGNCSEGFIDAMLDHAEQTGYLFSIEAVAESVPSILNSDELNIGCPGQTMRMEFMSVMSSNTTMVRTLTCNHRAEGMMCTPPEEGVRYFIDDPRKTIELSDSISYTDSMKIFDWFRTDAGTLLTDAEKNQMRELAWRLKISREQDMYHFALGEPRCECVFEASLHIPDIAAIEPDIAMVERQFVCPGSR